MGEHSTDWLRIGAVTWAAVATAAGLAAARRAASWRTEAHELQDQLEEWTGTDAGGG